MSATPNHWHAPRNAALTPWYSPQGWFKLAMHRSGHGYRKLWQATLALHQTLPTDPTGVQVPSAVEIIRARQAIVQLQWQAQDRAARQATKLQALLLVAQLACQHIGQRASFPQLLAAVTMTEGYLIQLAPGEGKTLAVAMAAVLQAWSGKPLHIVTANDYLAARDAELMQPLFAACGVSVTAITSDTPPHELANCYRQGVVYATAKQLLADFLRDDLLLDGARDPLHRRLWHLHNQQAERQPVMRGLYAVIIDEADGILIDEATTPLIIASAEKDKANMLQAIRQARDLVDAMKLNEDYTLYTKGGGSVHFTEKGKQKIERLAQVFSSYWQVPTRREEIFTLAIMAREVFQLDRHYIIQEGAVVIVDESTGRSMPGRSWSHGIHQSIEARAGVELTPLTKISARMTFQEFFRHYHQLSGASGTLHGLDLELWQTFGLLILRVPPRVPSQLKVLPKRCFITRKDKLNGFIERIVALHQRGLPVLVGTRRILDSEEIANLLRARGLACTVLNAKEHAYEAQVVAMAGEYGCITVATNMAGRGTDIKISPEVQAAGGLQVLMFEAHESPRIDWQLFGRAGRQGAKGSAQAFVSLQEELITKYTPAWFKPLAGLVPDQRTRVKIAVMQWLAQKTASSLARRQRSHLAFVQKQLREQLGFSKG
ncbi:MAG: prepilin peptidase [Comamonadaceae bacterium CG12_big_fil_rev_8_21_14_0_65_59_15]|nr:MAG: prepilin peptidase [Comamonadaceae bacterium CG12_big_fil_rev_8_21_14_0_65_59_15]